MRTAGVDWAGPKGVYYTLDGQAALEGKVPVDHADDLFEMLDRLTESTRIVLEPAFESFLPGRRERFIELARSRNHDLGRVSDRQTPRMRKELGLDKSDESDAIAIWFVAMERHVSPIYAASEVSEEWKTRAARLNHQVMVARYTGGRPRLVEEVGSILGPPRELPEHLRRTLLDASGRRYLMFLAEVYVAAREADSRKEFERLLGLYQNGWASMLRAEPHRMGWEVVEKRGLTQSQFRRVLREVYHKVKAYHRDRASDNP